MNNLTKDKATELANKLLELASSASSVPDRLLHCRQILEQLYKALTEELKLSFSGLFARMQYVHEAANVPAELNKQANMLRILCNRIAHDEFADPAEADLYSAVAIIYALLKLFSNGFHHAPLEDYTTRHKAKSKIEFQEQPKHSFICLVDKWQVNKASPTEAYLEIIATCEDGSQCCIILRDDTNRAGHEGRQYTLLANSLWRHACINCINLTKVAGRDGVLQSNPLTQVVLEPDFLVDASAVAECFGSSVGNPVSFILGKMLDEPSSEAMLMGTMVNGIFDELFFLPESDYIELFKSSLALMPIAMVSLGKDPSLRIYKRIREEHLPQLKSFCAGFSDTELLLEPSFICPEYGLQGRLDLLHSSNGKHSIVELKSGKAPFSDVWQSHHMQAVAYNMIIRQAYGANRVSNSAILYSAQKDNSLRHVVTIQALEQDLLMCRNRIVGIMHLLAVNPSAFFSWLIKQEHIPNHKFLNDKLKRIQNICNNLQAYEYEWFLAQVQRIVREIWFVKTGDNGTHRESSYGYNSLWQESVSEKTRAYKIVTGLKPLSYNKKQITLAIPPSDDIADFREGDIVVLYNRNLPITSQPMMRGVISSLDWDQIVITVRGGLKNHQDLTPESLWVIEHDTLETSLYSPLASLTQFLASESSLRQRFIGTQLPKAANTDHLEQGLSGIITRMHASEELFIVQGPPGTGKTSGLLGTYIREFHAQTNKKALILSFTNRAVDEICLCLNREQVPYIRAGNSTVIKDQLLNNLMEGKRFEEMEEIIKSNRIWVATVQSANAWYQDLLRIVKIDELIIDEASQIIESSILGLIANAPKTILIGDQNQLPPITVQSPLPYQFVSEELKSLFYGNYHQSLMERMHKVLLHNELHGNLAMLCQHYRMHVSIASLISETYYNQLVPVLDRQFQPLLPNPMLPGFLNTRLIWIECPPSQITHYDPNQVKLVIAILERLFSANAIDGFAADIGIIAPFRAMIHALRKDLPDAFKGITIDTVERFQGSERANIILCLPLRSPGNLAQVESLSDDGSVDRKLNVAISRAKERLIILGNTKLCGNSVHYSRLISNISSNGMIIDYDTACNDLL